MKEVVLTIIGAIVTLSVAYINNLGGIATYMSNRKKNSTEKKRLLKDKQEPESNKQEIESDLIPDQKEEMEIQPQIEENKNNDEELKVYILDDNVDDIEFVVRVVKKMGERYEQFSDKEKHLARIPNTPNIHIIDHYLRMGYGWEILVELKRRNKRNFVILYSGTQDKKTVSGYEPYKIDRVIYKDDPDRMILLENAIREGLNLIRGIH